MGGVPASNRGINPEFTGAIDVVSVTYSDEMVELTPIDDPWPFERVATFVVDDSWEHDACGCQKCHPEIHMKPWEPN